MSNTKSIFNTLSVLLVGFAILAVQVRHVLADSDIVSETDRSAFDNQDPNIDKLKYDRSAENQDCLSTGLMWVNGPSEPEIAAQAQHNLEEIGIDSSIEARGYGEIDNCGSYSQHGVDFTITLLQSEMSIQSTDQELANEVLPVLTTFGKPTLGNVTVIDSLGNVIPLVTSDDASNDLQTLDAEPFPTDAIFKKVYVIVYDPLLNSGQKLSEYKHWNDHSVITQQTIDFFKQVSSDKLNYSVVDTTIVTSGWPELTDGFSYTETEYLAVLAGQQSPHSPTGVNYNKIVNSAQFDICGKLNRGEIDEVWIYNGPWFGFYEFTLAGPGAYFYNSTPVSGSHGCNRLVPIMGPSVERTKDESVHNFTHRAESTMSKVYGGWLQNSTSHNWNKFGLVKAQSANYTYSGCGSSHYPPNATSDYNYANVTPVLSNCDDFINYPNLSDPLQVSQPITCASWGCTSWGFYAYWFGRFPPYSGCGPDNVANDWWNYVAEPGFALFPSNACQTDMRVISGNVGISGVSLTYTDGIQKTVTADIYGNYFLMVSNQWSGAITPIKDGGYTFNPAIGNYSNVQSNLYNQNYAPVLNGPEINIKGNNILINDEDSTPALTDYTNFGNVQVTGGSVSRTFTIYNTGAGNLNLTGSPKAIVSGINANDFSVSVQPSSPITPSGSTTLTVVFDAGAIGIRTASISIANDDSTENPYNFSIQGTGDINEIDVRGSNDISILDGDTSPSLSDYTSFGSIPVAAGSVSRTFTIYNTGANDLNLTDSPKVTLSGTHISDFSVTAQPSSPIAPAGSTSFTVEFDPSGSGLRSASISIANNDADENPYNFSISGTGTISPEIDIQGTTGSILDGDTTPSLTDDTDFGSVLMPGAVSHTFTIYNTGNDNLTLTGSPSKVLIASGNSSDFIVTTQPSTPILPGGSTTFTIAFSPTGSGLRTTSLSVYSNDSSENPYNFSIQGTAIGPEMDVKGNSITISDGDSVPFISDNTDFGSIPVTNGTISRTFTIYNNGNDDLNLAGSPKVTVSGTDASDFSVTVQPSSPVAALGSTTFTVMFDPGAGGVRTASISITNNDSNENPYNFSIQGIGDVYPEMEVKGNSVSILDGDSTPSTTDHTNFGSIPVAAGSVSRTFTIYNTGVSDLNLTNPLKVSISGTHASDFSVTVQPSSPILPSTSATFTVVFDPGAEGTRSALISIANDDSNENPYNFSIQGTGTTFLK